jgi:hypothetical protein
MSASGRFLKSMRLLNFERMSADGDIVYVCVVPAQNFFTLGSNCDVFIWPLLLDHYCFLSFSRYNGQRKENFVHPSCF